MAVRTILGESYRTVIMPDGKEWMAEDLRYAGSLTYNESGYGKRYLPNASFVSFFSNLDDRWRIPTQDDWRNMGLAINPAPGVGADLAYAGGPLKEAGFAHWNSPNTSATDAYGFTGLPNSIDGTNAGWWTDTMDGTSYRRVLGIDNASAYFGFGSAGITTTYYALRLVREYVVDFIQTFFEKSIKTPASSSSLFSNQYNNISSKTFNRIKTNKFPLYAVDCSNDLVAPAEVYSMLNFIRTNRGQYFTLEITQENIFGVVGEYEVIISDFEYKRRQNGFYDVTYTLSLR